MLSVDILTHISEETGVFRDEIPCPKTHWYQMAEHSLFQVWVTLELRVKYQHPV
jgi:hypothetical protein